MDICSNAAFKGVLKPFRSDPHLLQLFATRVRGLSLGKHKARALFSVLKTQLLTNTNGNKLFAH